jgi:hypothetical protein
MASILQQYVNFNQIYNTASSYAPSNQSINNAKAFFWNNYNYIYNTARGYVPSDQSIDRAKAFLWNNKEVIIASAVVGLVIWKIVH